MHESAGQGTRVKNGLERGAITAARRTPAVSGCAPQTFAEDECGNSNEEDRFCFRKAFTFENAFQARNLTPELSRGAKRHRLERLVRLQHSPERLSRTTRAARAQLDEHRASESVGKAEPSTWPKHRVYSQRAFR